MLKNAPVTCYMLLLAVRQDESAASWCLLSGHALSSQPLARSVPDSLVHDLSATHASEFQSLLGAGADSRHRHPTLLSGTPLRSTNFSPKCSS